VEGRAPRTLPAQNAALAWLRELDPRLRIAAVAALAVLLLAVAVLVFASARLGPAATTTSTPTPPPATQTPRIARATPVGTPGPRPTTFVGIAASVPVSPPSAPRPTASPEPGLWRLEGYVVDEQGKPIENVCVVIGPVGCQPYSPHTDERGNYSFDVAASPLLTNYDFYFEMPGYRTVWLRMVPTGSTTFNAVLKRG
jgi:hypothetical protein